MIPRPSIKKGNALIVAIILIALFMVLSMGVSALIMQSVLTVTSTEGSQHSFYASEAGVEMSLLSLKKHLPGYEEQKAIALSTTTKVDYSIVARTNKIPLVNHNILLPEQTVTLSLFKDIGSGDTVSIFNLSPDSDVFDIELTSLGQQPFCLQWTILGFENTSEETESITDYVCPLSQPFHLQSQSLIGKTKDADGTFHPQLAVHEFLRTHSQNYLTLTNMQDPNKTSAPILYTITFVNHSMADAVFTITSMGHYKNFEQREQVIVPQGDLFPAFHFAIFNPS